MINNDALTARVCTVIARRLGVRADELTVDTDLVTDLGVDSLDMIELIDTLENVFSVEFPFDGPEIRRVGDLVSKIRQLSA